MDCIVQWGPQSFHHLTEWLSLSYIWLHWVLVVPQGSWVHCGMQWSSSQSGVELCPLHWEREALATEPPGSPRRAFLNTRKDEDLAPLSLLSRFSFCSCPLSLPSVTCFPSLLASFTLTLSCICVYPSPLLCGSLFLLYFHFSISASPLAIRMNTTFTHTRYALEHIHNPTQLTLPQTSHSHTLIGTEACPHSRSL